MCKYQKMTESRKFEVQVNAYKGISRKKQSGSTLSAPVFHVLHLSLGNFNFNPAMD